MARQYTLLAAAAAAVSFIPSLVSAQNTQACADLVTALNACPAPATTSFANAVTAMNDCLCSAATNTAYTACLTSVQATQPAATGVPIDGLNFGPASALTSICTLFATDVTAATAAGIRNSNQAYEAFTTSSQAQLQPPAGASVAAVGGGVGLTGTDYLGAQVVLAGATTNTGLTLQGVLGFPASITVSTSTTSSSTISSTTGSTLVAGATTDSSTLTSTGSGLSSSLSYATATESTALPGQPAQTKSSNVFTGEANKRESRAVAGMLLAAVVGAAWLL